jgi:hypothetical protein
MMESPFQSVPLMLASPTLSDLQRMEQPYNYSALQLERATQDWQLEDIGIVDLLTFRMYAEKNSVRQELSWMRGRGETAWVAVEGVRLSGYPQAVGTEPFRRRTWNCPNRDRTCGSLHDLEMPFGLSMSCVVVVAVVGVRSMPLVSFAVACEAECCASGTRGMLAGRQRQMEWRRRRAAKTVGSHLRAQDFDARRATSA